MTNIENIFRYEDNVVTIGNETCYLTMNLDTGNIELVGSNFVAKNVGETMMGKFLANANFVNIGDIESTNNATTLTLHDNTHSIDTNPAIL